MIDEYGDNNEYGDNSRGAKYAFAMAFLFFVPGSLLAVFSRFQPVLLPRTIVEFLFPLALLPVEKQLILAQSNHDVSVGQARMNLEIFDRLDIFDQQVFVIAFLCFLSILVLYGLKARAGALLAEPTLQMMPVLAVVILMSVVMRLFFAYLLVANMNSVISSSPTQIAVFHLLNAFAPEGLVLFSCLLAISVAQIVLFICRLLAERIRWL